MHIKNSNLPPEKVVISTVGEKCTVQLWDGSYTETSEPSPEGGEQPAYEYDIYLYPTTDRPNLKKAVESHLDVWMAAAKAREAAEDRRARIAELSKTRESDIETAIAELGEIIAEQEEALVEIAGMLS